MTLTAKMTRIVGLTTLLGVLFLPFYALCSFLNIDTLILADRNGTVIGEIDDAQADNLLEPLNGDHSKIHSNEDESFTDDELMQDNVGNKIGMNNHTLQRIAGEKANTTQWDTAMRCFADGPNGFHIKDPKQFDNVTFAEWINGTAVEANDRDDNTLKRYTFCKVDDKIFTFIGRCELTATGQQFWHIITIVVNNIKGAKNYYGKLGGDTNHRPANPAECR